MTAQNNDPTILVQEQKDLGWLFLPPSFLPFSLFIKGIKFQGLYTYCFWVWLFLKSQFNLLLKSHGNQEIHTYKDEKMHTEMRKLKREAINGVGFYKHTESMRGESRTGLLGQMRHAYFPLESCLYEEEEDDDEGNIRSSILLFLCWASPAQLSPPNTLISLRIRWQRETRQVERVV